MWSRRGCCQRRTQWTNPGSWLEQDVEAQVCIQRPHSQPPASLALGETLLASP